MKVTIDRIVKNIAVCEKEDLTRINIPINQLPHEAQEGDILLIEGEQIIVDKEATEIKRSKIKKRFNN